MRDGHLATAMHGIYPAKTIIDNGQPVIDGQLQAYNCHAQPTANEQHMADGTRLTVHNRNGSTHAQHPTIKHTAPNRTMGN